MKNILIFTSLLVSLIYAAPECRYIADDPICHAECKAHCDINCQFHFFNLNMSAPVNATPYCVPHCVSADVSEMDSCPFCEIKCRAAPGACPPDKCQIQCEMPVCGWVCRKPKDCPLPTFQLMCERPVCESQTAVWDFDDKQQETTLPQSSVDDNNEQTTQISSEANEVVRVLSFWLQFWEVGIACIILDVFS